MGCPGCLLTAKEKQGQLEKIVAEAKKYAIDRQTIYVIYILPDGDYGCMAADTARQIGITPIKFISHLIPATHGPVPDGTV